MKLLLAVKPSSLVEQIGGAKRSGAVVALKPGRLAKSRLGSLADPLRQRVAWAMAVDTLQALSAVVDELLVVSDETALESRLRSAGVSVSVRAEPGHVGMNGALGFGAAELQQQGCDLVLACVGDLPALRPESVERVLQAASSSSPSAGARCFLADMSGFGTTMLLAHGRALTPRFSGASAAAHRASGALALTDELLGAPVVDARRDVDTEADLLEAWQLGLGPSTAALIDPAVGAPGVYRSLTVTDQRDPAGDQLAVPADGLPVPLPARALQDGLSMVQPGTRLHAVLSPSTVLAAWA